MDVEVDTCRHAWVADLLDWYRQCARDLPWRRRSDAYAIWISEVMLQQTRVETVMDYFQRFLKRFPRVEDLAAAPRDQVLKLWEGLGYYSRATRMHETAQLVVKDYGGEFPRSVEGLQTLPGIGPYTAAAVASMAFNLPHPAIDGNGFRVLARFFAREDDVSRTKTRAVFETLMHCYLPLECPGDFNQAVMDLGARVCVPGEPRCERCPIAQGCQGHARGIAADLPIKSGRNKVAERSRVLLALRHEDAYLLHRRSDKGLLAGLWEFPGSYDETPAALVAELQSEYGLMLGPLECLLRYSHVFSHQRWHVHLYHGAVIYAEFLSSDDWAWYHPSHWESLTWARAFAPARQAVEDRFGPSASRTTP